MKTLVIGLDGAVPELLLENEQLTNIRQLMEAGCFGRLESIVPPITVPAWACMATSRDPGTLGVYGFRNRTDYSYAPLGIVNSRSVRAMHVWDQFACEGRRSTVVGVPPNFPPRKVNGVSVGCFLTPDAEQQAFTHPPEVGERITREFGDYPVDVRGFRTENKTWLRDQIFAMTRRHFEVIRHLMQTTDWDYLQFVEIGLDRLQHGFWKHHDPQHRRHPSETEFGNVIRDYYCELDEEIGRLFELLDDETLVLVLSDHGAQRLDGGFCINEWLMQEGELALATEPTEPTPLSRLDIDWDHTRVWGEGGYYARIFLNVKGREPQGTIDPLDYDKVRDDLIARLEATVDDEGRPMGTRAFRPEDIYRDVGNIAPDLIVHLGGLYWRSIGSVGYGQVHVEENDTGPDDCNHSQFGAFVLAGGAVPLQGEVTGAHLLDMAPTLLELSCCDVPEGMQGRSLAGAETADRECVLTGSDAELVRERLSGLGYI